MADADVPIKYMDRTRHYYRALGYAQDYIWATAEAVCPACGGQTIARSTVSSSRRLVTAYVGISAA
jgi:hypothetical protein